VLLCWNVVAPILQNPFESDEDISLLLSVTSTIVSYSLDRLWNYPHRVLSGKPKGFFLSLHPAICIAHSQSVLTHTRARTPQSIPTHTCTLTSKRSHTHTCTLTSKRSHTHVCTHTSKRSHTQIKMASNENYISNLKLRIIQDQRHRCPGVNFISILWAKLTDISN
jgi:hypothetical protein